MSLVELISFKKDLFIFKKFVPQENIFSKNFDQPDLEKLKNIFP